MSELDEVHLMQRIVAREQAAVTELYDQFAPMVYGMTMRVLQNTTLAEEATQDTFMKIWQQADQWDPERGKLVSWLLTIARYTAIDRLRKEKRQSPWTAIGLEDMLTMVGKTSVVKQQKWADAEVLKQLLMDLTDEQRQAIELAFFSGMSHTEVADHLGVPLGTIKSRIRQGLRTLKGLWLAEVDEA